MKIQIKWINYKNSIDIYSNEMKKNEKKEDKSIETNLTLSISKK